MSLIAKGHFIQPIPGISFTTSLPFFTAAPLYEMLWGRKALASLYTTHRVADLVYFQNITGTLVQLTANVMIVLALIKSVTMEQSVRINNKMFMCYGIVSVTMITAVLGPCTCLMYVFVCGLAIPFHKIFPVKNLSKNQKDLGLFVGENAANSMGLGLKGTTLTKKKYFHLMCSFVCL